MAIRTERSYFAVVGYDDRLFFRTIAWRAKDARAAALDMLPTHYPQTWASCRKLGFRVVKVAITEYLPRPLRNK